VVCGRRQERHPDASIYNRLCDLEWVIPAGDVDACGGDAMMRAAALQQVGGFDDTMIAGEEPELCLRLRRQGHRIRSLGEPMTLHDAAMVRFRQWWLRAVRAGHAQAESAARHGRDYPRLRAVRSSLLFGLLVPLTAVVGCAIAAGRGALPVAAVFLSLWPASWLLLAVRIFVRERARRGRAGDALLLAASCVLAKVPELQGMLAYGLRRWRRRRPQIIEYKTGGAS
jgi:hypothetical protein